MLFYTKTLSLKKKAFLREKISIFQAKGHRSPHLACIIVGTNKASQLYVGMKRKECLAIGMTTSLESFPEQASTQDILACVSKLNANPNIDGILVQLPLPAQIARDQILEHIAPDKDIDGLTPINQGLLVLGRPLFIPCTPKGILAILEELGTEIAGKKACVIGRSFLVGSPVASLLCQKNATVTTVHSQTTNPKEITSKADILIIAAGHAKLVDKSWVKKGAIVIDVGIHHQNGRVVGDSNQEDLIGHAKILTPVPGGVGPMTIASLLENCFLAYERRLATSAT